MLHDFLLTLNYKGLLIGVFTFIIIGLYHPLVIKGEYYFGRKIRWWFLLSGIVFLLCSIIITDVFISTIFGVAAFSSFWSIKEVDEQVERVKKGWFPANPKRKNKEEC